MVQHGSLVSVQGKERRKSKQKTHKTVTMVHTKRKYINVQICTVIDLYVQFSSPAYSFKKPRRQKVQGLMYQCKQVEFRSEFSPVRAEYHRSGYGNFWQRGVRSSDCRKEAVFQ